MSAKSHHIVDRLAEQLGGFEDQLRVSGTGAEVLKEMRDSIGALLTVDMDNENVVRRMLQEHLEQGLLRKNSFRVALSILDQTVSETTSSRLQAANASDADSPLAAAADEDPESPTSPDVPPFDSTVVIPADPFAKVRSGQDLRPGSVLCDRFVLDKVVSRRSIGALYLAFDQQVEAVKRDETRVAITILSPEITGNEQAVRTLQKISRRARRLAHPNIAHFNDLYRDGDVVFLSTEWIDGRSLADIIESSDARRIDRIAAFRIAHELAIALDYAHRCGVVHADIAPGNIMIAQDGCARLADSVTARAKLLRLRSMSDKRAASTTYASRQVLLGERLSASDDVFSLACLLYRLLAGYRVFGPRNAAEAFAAGMPPQRPEGLDNSQWHALEKALRLEPEERFESIPEFMAALDGAEDLATSVQRAPSGKVTDKRQSAMWLFAGAITAMLVVFGVYFSGVLTTGSDGVTSAQSSVISASTGDPSPVRKNSSLVPRQTVLASSPRQERNSADVNSRGAPAEEAAFGPLPYSDIEPVAVVAEKPAARAPELPANAVGFADDHVLVHENDSAVQIDITRFNPDQQSFSIGYFVNDITAKEGQDYFAPNSYSIPFGPGQDTARLLIPLVQDTVTEGAETFVIRLLENDTAPAVIEAQSVVVTIRDDVPQSP
ncbi:MAG: protein kinase [Gammaproteobacteria bacterium]|nr:protein kinase [Gammaproteobacteria bacterium]